MSDKLIIQKYDLLLEKISILDKKISDLSVPEGQILINSLDFSEIVLDVFRVNNIVYLHQLKEIDLVQFLKKNKTLIKPTILLKEISTHINDC